MSDRLTYDELCSLGLVRDVSHVSSPSMAQVCPREWGLQQALEMWDVKDGVSGPGE